MIVSLIVATAYGVANWYMFSEASLPYRQGVSFIADYASNLGLDAHNTLRAVLDDLQVKNLRLVSYWSDIEPAPGHFDFSELDWEFVQASSHHARVSLSIGLRQPRWPECHAPTWVNLSAPESQWRPALDGFMRTVIERYRSNPALGDYELENEFFNNAFGTCTNFDRARLVSEYNLVKGLDRKHPVIVSRSNNDLGTPIGPPTPDEYGVSIYQRVWNPRIGHYIEYPYPAWYYAFLAGFQKIFNHRDMVIHELQAEPWPPHGQPITSVSLTVQDQSLDPERLQRRFGFARATGIRTVYFWGAEYWYYRLRTLHDPSVWAIARANFHAPEQRSDLKWFLEGLLVSAVVGVRTGRTLDVDREP